MKALFTNSIPSAKPKTNTPKAADSVSLAAICAELKLDPRHAREKLRIAARDGKKFPELGIAHKPRSAWMWPKGSEAERQAREAVTA